MNTTTSGAAAAIASQVIRTEGVPCDPSRLSPPAASIISGTQCPPLNGGSPHSKAKVRGRWRPATDCFTSSRRRRSCPTNACASGRVPLTVPTCSTQSRTSSSELGSSETTWAGLAPAGSAKWDMRRLPRASGGQSHSCVTPTRSSPRFRAYTISVADGRSDTIRMATIVTDTRVAVRFASGRRRPRRHPCRTPQVPQSRAVAGCSVPTLGPRVVISGTHSGVGKTTVAVGLMAALTSRGRRVVSAKVGPDFIDPGYHSLATGYPGRSLDAWLSGEDNIASLAAAGAEGTDLLIIEGVMGLFDGSAQPGCDGSTAAVARLLEA